MKKSFFVFLSAFLFFINKPILIKAQVNVSDSLALVDIYNSTDGPHWKNKERWLTSKPLSRWEGVTVTNNRVTGLNFTETGMNGKLPATIGNLSELTSLNIYYNMKLRGPIPHEIGNCTKLTSLNLGYTKLNGYLPHEIGNLINLSKLIITYCDIKGKIPNIFSNLTNLTNFAISNTQITGEIPRYIKKFTSLTNLSLSHNQLSGKIPYEIGDIKTLVSIDLGYNHLTGTMPASFGRSKKRYLIDITSNEIYGPVPSSFQNLKWKTRVYIQYNNFTFAGIEETKHHLQYKVDPQHEVPLYQSGNKIWVAVGGTPSNNTFSWFKDGLLIATITADSTFTVAESGTYYVKANNAVMKNFTLKSEKLSIHVSTNQVASNSKIVKRNFVSAYPNPVKTNTTLTFSADGKYTISIVDITGKTLQTINGVSNKTQNVINLNLSHFTNGVYNIIITDGKNEKRVLKIIKE
ncbi:MAG: T9SS type A sorting domain-containing protein [Bacteroidetes bacterium]|nr:T9SS type A sorting domain-containing protein [Bacteroidota bacterium]